MKTVQRRAWARRALGLALLVLCAGAAWVAWRYQQDLALATARTAEGSAVVRTPCGPIEYQARGAGRPLLVVHGSGGGHDQGMDFALPLVPGGVRVIAVSRFGYLRTPRPPVATPEAQADAHRCLLDALGLRQAAVLGVSAGAPSALQAVIRHPDRFTALMLVVPIGHRPDQVPASAPPVSDGQDRVLLQLLGSDFVYWSTRQLAWPLLLRHLLATPPEQFRAADAAEQARVRAMADHILPVSLRRQGLLDDTRLGKRLGPQDLSAVRVPTLLVSARDDGFGTYATARYMASQIPGARFVGFEQGGHLLVGHHQALRDLMAEWLRL